MDNKPQRVPKDLASLETQSLETHVVVSMKDMKKYKKDLIKLIYVWTEWKNIQISNLLKLKELLYGLWVRYSLHC